LIFVDLQKAYKTTSGTDNKSMVVGEVFNPSKGCAPTNRGLVIETLSIDWTDHETILSGDNSCMLREIFCISPKSTNKIHWDWTT
jgi:hypothetical protein